MHRVRYRANTGTHSGVTYKRDVRWAGDDYHRHQSKRNLSKNSSTVAPGRSSIARISTFSKSAVKGASKNISVRRESKNASV